MYVISLYYCNIVLYHVQNITIYCDVSQCNIIYRLYYSAKNQDKMILSHK